MSNITVYTSITASKDSLIEDQKKGNARFIAFVDSSIPSETWECKESYKQFTDPRRNSRIQKILAHQYIDSEYSIYIDGNIKLLKTPEELIEKYLKDCDIAFYKHPNRDCLYDEAIQCAKQRLDDPEVIIEQAKKYEDSGFAKHKGLCECGIIFRRHTPKIEAFNNAWWSEYCRHSRRDQISCPYALDRTGTQALFIADFFIIDGKNSAIKQSGDFSIITHNHFS